MNSKRSLALSLLILVILSKEVLVFNEEILVLLAFSVFVFLIYNFASDLISSELDSRNAKIEQEFVFYNDVQKRTFLHLISYNRKQILLSEEVKLIYSILKKDITLLVVNYSNLFVNYLSNCIDDKLKKIVSAENKLNEILKKKLNDELCFFLISRYKRISSEGFVLVLKSSILSLSIIK